MPRETISHTPPPFPPNETYTRDSHSFPSSRGVVHGVEGRWEIALRGMRGLRAFLVPLAALAADRFLKIIALSTPHPAWGGLFALHRNPGAAFSIALPGIIMMIGLALALIVVCGAIVHELKKSSPDMLPYFFILAGALSNIFDRLQCGAVIDYFVVPLVGLFFNLADMMILGGILLFVLHRSGPPKFFNQLH